MKFTMLALGVSMMAVIAAPAVAQTQRLVTEEMMVKTADPLVTWAPLTDWRPEPVTR